MLATNYNHLPNQKNIPYPNPSSRTNRTPSPPTYDEIDLNMPPPPPTYAQLVVQAGLQGTVSYWFGYGIAKLGFSQGITPVDFARLSCISSVVRPALSNQTKSLLGCKGDKSWRDITELFITSVGTNLIGCGVCALFGSRIDISSLVKSTVLQTSFAVLSEQLMEIIKKNTPTEEIEEDLNVEPEEEHLNSSKPLQIETSDQDILTFEED